MMDHEEHAGRPEPIPPASRPLMGEPNQDQVYAAAGGGGFMALAFAKGVRTSGWTRTVSILAVAVIALTLLAFVLAALI